MEENYIIKIVFSWDVLDLPILFNNNMYSSFPSLENPLIPKKQFNERQKYQMYERFYIHSTVEDVNK